MTDRRAYWTILTRSLGTFLRGQLLSAVAVAVMATLVLWLVGVRWPFILGPMIGGLAAVPVLGTGLGTLLGVLVALGERGAMGALWTAVGLVGVQLADNWVVSPRLQAAGFGLHPLAALAAVLVGGVLLAPILGPFAPILALPLAIALRDARRYRRLRMGEGALSAEAALGRVLAYAVKLSADESSVPTQAA